MKAIIELVKLGSVALLAAIGGCSSQTPAAKVQNQFTVVSGKIVATNGVSANSPKPAVLRIRDSKGNTSKVVLPAGKTQNLVRASAAKLRVGGEIEVTGDKTEKGDIWAYKPGHLLRIITWSPGVTTLRPSQGS